MPFDAHIPGHREFLYGNVRVASVDADLATQTLTLHGVYAQHETIRIIYRDVFCSDLQPSLAGKRIAACLDLVPEDLTQARYLRIADRLREHCGLGSPDRLRDITLQGYHFFAHFIEQSEEGIVIARQCSIQS